ncbi:MAG: hypothetical protein GF341_04895 [candidate division Zixibacteria bacterium]|nr:hypothetical protein [candidate division Zixibacteria bacterium]
MRTYSNVPVGLAVAFVLLLGLLHSESRAGIRMDGTEFQSGSQASKLDASTRAASPTISIPPNRLVYTFGQAILAKGEITNAATGEAVKIGLGYDFNAQNTTFWGCTCPNQGTVVTDAEDDAVNISNAINALFYNGPNPHDPLCPVFRIDADCDGFTTAADLSILINQVFFNGPAPCEPCTTE